MSQNARDGSYASIRPAVSHAGQAVLARCTTSSNDVRDTWGANWEWPNKHCGRGYTQV